MSRSSKVLLTSILTLSIASIVACSSSSKKSSAAPAAKPTAATAAKAVAAPAADAKKAKAAKKTEKAAASTEGEGSPEGTVTCTSGSTKREITVVKKDDHCSVEYNKDGTSSEVATGSSTSSKCKDTQAKIRENLEKAGYTCQ